MVYLRVAHATNLQVGWNTSETQPIQVIRTVHCGPNDLLRKH